MTTITISFKRGDYSSLDESFITEIRECIEITEHKPDNLSMVIREEFDDG